ncbi:hypothetical protein DIPPA_26864 [Diplonema papillatum]|nr:hypothetical protein DIPPA_26864 [Diplonema papillatum]
MTASHTTSNPVESWINVIKEARSMHVLGFFRWIRTWLAKKCVKRAEEAAEKDPNTPTDYAISSIEKADRLARRLKGSDITQLRRGVWKVGSFEASIDVSGDVPRRWECSCAPAKRSLLPCEHALAVAKKVDVEASDLVPKVYRWGAVLSLYDGG